MRECRPTSATQPSRRTPRRVLSGAAAVLLGAGLLVPSPASAAPACGPAGTESLTETPWALRRLEPSSAWPLSRGAGVTVAVIDSGVSATHPLLKGQVLEGRDFNNLPANQGQCDEAGHGTLIAGIIAGREGAGVPFSGVAPAARILPIRVLPQLGDVSDEQLPAEIAAAIDWAVAQGADVINLSLTTIPQPELTAAVERALAKRVVLVAAAGNRSENSQNRPGYPAAYPGVIAVGGVDEQGGHVGTSISGDYVDIAAPGLNIVGPAPRGDGYRAVPDGGTSYAAAYVSGTAALVRAAYPQLTPQQVAERLERTADNPPEGHNADIGYGMVNPYRAVSSLLGTRANPPAGAIPAPAPRDDPLGWQRSVAVWAAVIGGLLTVLLLVVRPIVTRGRRRDWRPGRRTDAPAAG
ncbi:type VII secretion-associated serine protease mycosin [Micromonospora sp. WMMD1120]|uniref:type VII secretion-associated serine protease mycosin n=1 Tax=Micromonospora sp. WMMD1120 TaxID=3016106 RepID=UPI002417D516|nr:type VII secretion-associated serine protease mycosin [Micromonospora sp. WMMD1120]MDG4807473.1 type VII secretion-associated serine protease mycosin [Micromonospora sp. WMMD1120]